jgi:hypothetical protein
MGWRIVKQPNGLLARFSDIVDDFTHYDLGEEEAIEICREHMGRIEAVDKVRRGMEDEECPPFINASGKNDGLDRYRDCLKTIKNVHGPEKAAERERMLSKVWISQN